MKKFKLLASSLLLISAAAAFSQGSITVISGTKGQNLYARGLSHDGSFLAGQAGNQHHMFVWKRDGQILIENDTHKLASAPGQMGSNALGVNSSGIVVGICPSPAHPYYDQNQIYEDCNIPIAAFFEFGAKKWNFLPVVSNRPLAYVFGPRAYAVSDDGAIIAGAQSPGSEAMRLIAGYWKKDSTGNYNYTALKEDAVASRGSAVKTMSGDGLVMGGFECEAFSYFPKPVLWISTDNGNSYVKKTIPRQNMGAVEAVSHNGKYAVLSILKGDDDYGYAALYDIENRQLTEIHPNAPSAALAVSDNGVVAGHFGGLYYGGQLSAQRLSPGYPIENGINSDGAYIFTKEMGAKLLKEFLDENNITYPTGFSFKAATGISADGKMICGHSASQSFYAEIPKITARGVFSATNFSIESPAYGSILLTWSPVPEDTGFVGYKIFNANNTMTPIATVTDTFYRINSLTDGTYSYYIVSSYKSDDAEKTRTLSHALNKTTLPIFEAFDNSLNSSWDVSQNTSTNSWFLDTESGYPPACAKFLSPIGGFYNESLTTPYFNATTTDTMLRLSFTIGIPASDIPGATEERMIVEIFADNVWRTLEDIPATEVLYSGWLPRSHNINTNRYASKENLRVRFRITGESVGATLNWFLDNVEIADRSNMFIEEVPLNMSANYVAEENKVHVQWSDPRGFVDLRYSVWDNPQDAVSSIGNERPFIAVNKYTAEDLSAFEGYKLTSISFIRGMNTDNAVTVGSNPTFKWFVSQGNERLFDLPVGNTQPGERTTLVLDNPITIDNTKPLYYGVEVTQQDPNDLPILTGYVWKHVSEGELIKAVGSPVADGRANLFSEDGGATWQKLSDYIEDSSQIFLIRATLAKDLTATKKERLLGYRVWRNDVNMLGDGNLTSINSFTDVQPLKGENNCYAVQAFYTTGYPSDEVEDCVNLSDITMNEQIKQINGNLKVYPSLVQSGETVTVEVNGAASGTLRLYDVNGKLLYNSRINPQTKQSIQLNVASGVYMLQLGNQETAKIIVK